ncbi:MAG: VWA domain-containing protein [Pseudomonadota bacterium]
MAGFIDHLRLNGFRLGPGDTADAVAALSQVDATDRDLARAALKVILVPDHDRWAAFDTLYDAYWMNAGRIQRRQAEAPHIHTQSSNPTLWQPRGDATQGIDGEDGGGAAGADPDGREDRAPSDGRLVATRKERLAHKDLRGLLSEEEVRAAEAAARRLAGALRDRRSRRRRAARRGSALDLRRILRMSLATGGEPVRLRRRHRPDRPVRIVVLCDVSGSMTHSARVFLAFVKGLVGAEDTADAWLFHTRLMRITPALADHDTLRAAGRLSLMAEGFGGGTDIAGNIMRFVEGQGARALSRRSVVLILSDGYCSGPPEALAGALERLARRAGRIVWLTPVPIAADGAVARHLAAIRPRVDAVLRADTIAGLAALETEFAKL